MRAPKRLDYDSNVPPLAVSWTMPYRIRLCRTMSYQKWLQLFGGASLCAVIGLAGCGPSTPVAPATAPNTGAAPSTEEGTASTNAGAPSKVETISFVEPKASEVYPKADETVELQEFFAAMKADASATKAKYADKIIEVQGKVTHYSSGDDHISLVIMLGEGMENRFAAGLIHQQPWIDYPPGSEVIVRGKAGGFLESMNSCGIVDGTKAVLEEESPADIRAAWDADTTRTKHEFAKQWSRKFVRIKGKVAAVKEMENNVIVTLGDGDGVDLKFELYEARRARLWKVGDDVEVIARYNLLYSSDRLTFDSVLPVSPVAELPPFPGVVERDGKSGKAQVRPFSADLMGRWAAEAPREFAVIRASQPDVDFEVTGAIASAERVQKALREETEFKLKNTSNGVISFSLDDDDLKKTGPLAVGDTVVALGNASVDGDGCEFGRVTVTKK